MDTGAPQPRSPLRFFALVLVLSLPFWAIGAVAAQAPSMLPVNLPVSALMFVCPAIASLLLVRHEAGADGVRALLRRAADYPRITNRLWYLPIIGLMPLVMLVSYGLMRLLRMPLPEPPTPFGLVPILALLFLVSAACEQLGWTGYCQGPLQARWGALGASLIIGTAWALWHIVPYLQAHHTPGWVLWQCIATVALRVLIGWLYNNAGESVFAAILFHAMIDVSTFAFPNYGSAYSPLVTAIVLVAVAALVIVIRGPARFARPRPFAPRGR